MKNKKQMKIFKAKSYTVEFVNYAGVVHMTGKRTFYKGKEPPFSLLWLGTSKLQKDIDKSLKIPKSYKKFTAKAIVTVRVLGGRVKLIFVAKPIYF
jgi:hypothetical protein